MKKHIFLLGAILSFAACSSPKQIPKGSSLDPASHPYKATVTWSASTNSPNGYSVEMSSDGGNSFSAVTTTSGLTTSLSGLISGQTYVVRVRAYNAAGYGPYSSVVVIP